MPTQQPATFQIGSRTRGINLAKESILKGGLSRRSQVRGTER